MLGFLNLNKPPGLTSHDCVARVRRLLKTKRIGHGGTLDPAACGVLPLAVGGATRLLPYLREHKAYRAKIRLGVKTTTDDLEGETLETRSASGLTLEQIAPRLEGFIGKIEQIPPAYSAIQRGGKRLYELARKGEVVEVPPRLVEINSIEVLGFSAGEYAELEVSIACGPGTYIRAIARDLGELLGVGGTLATLTRTQSCGFHLRDSSNFEELEQRVRLGNFSLIPAEVALKHLPAAMLSAHSAKRWCQGQAISDWKRISELDRELPNRPSVLRVRHEGGEFLGIGESSEFSANPLLIPKIVLSCKCD